MSAAWPLFGHAEAERRFLDAHARTRLHHAWLIEGPEGIGKHRFALRLAAFLLGARGPDAAPLDAGERDPVWRAVYAASHPDLRTLQRGLNDKGKLMQDISVEQVRTLTEFFTMKPALGGWRIGIIDAIDETNRNGANALLKTLEEPPPKCVLFLINHGREPLLPTIRSRCRVLKLSALSDEDCQRALDAAGAPQQAARIAKGRPGKGIRLSSPPALAAVEAARALLRSAPNFSDKLAMSALTAAAVDDASIEAFRAELLDWIADRAEADPSAARVWLKQARLAADGEQLNMDAAQVASKLVAGLYELAQAV
ncbi:MAG: DNA polymerase III subunit delta' [Hyphomonas sp.]|uniref:DNA polymerase III subunit delta' n=1 Tax=Hyphomonas sp. TaxID=87 RepID=UPI0034A02FA5